LFASARAVLRDLPDEGHVPALVQLVVRHLPHRLAGRRVRGKSLTSVRLCGKCAHELAVLGVSGCGSAPHSS
jgi:hypothetical protein